MRKNATIVSLNIKTAIFFFSEYVIITESTVDCGIISHLLENDEICAVDAGITFVPANGEKNIKYPYAVLKELGIPFFCVVDRDVFQPYTGADRKGSINENGVPTYKRELKTSSPILSLISTQDQEKLLSFLISGEYERELDLLDTYSIIAMRYAIEVDLIICNSFLNSYCDVLNIEGENRTAHFLAVERGRAIKRLDNICNVLDRTSSRNLPKSYRRIIKKTHQMIE